MEEVIKNLGERVNSGLEFLASELSGIRTSRPASALVEDIKVSVYDQELPIKQLGSISIVPPNQIVISFWDKEAVAPTSKALEASGRGFNVSSKEDGSIYISLPPLSMERREELSKLAKSTGEKFRIQLRNLRDEANKKMNVLELSEDQARTAKKKVQELIDKGNEKIESSLKQKLNELLA
ncbi:MAG: ribosome recycling factor [Candidatus Harrisonbacteria bacterium CG10_big_fil_rev_8_21_14_0_10_38_8]|uniref:Ribosome recycling factor n=1 Tax=Candidatus Harrisonbacteria bacterium CG10_big_fil_rev_8_21_14_0_10_38_8 TaxID=1974582 RepID=A0A2M6WK27_9BACT|nr:MAG: ribosome recycling factor [Candidatus Harrisonbacteria bacterium CG10_big_fil_rev_8_21_14_0_10_38_8]